MIAIVLAPDEDEGTSEETETDPTVNMGLALTSGPKG